MIEIYNWSSYQSYKDRRPPWIRFHKSMLDNYEYHSMSAEARALLPMLWLLASEDEDPTSGLIRDSYEKITFRLRIRNEVFTESLRELELAGFVSIKSLDDSQCNETVTKPLQNRNETVTPETETETETDLCEFDIFWAAYPKKTDKQKAREKFKSKVKGNFAEVMAGLKSYKAEIAQKKLEPRYIKHAKTWLEGKCWENEPEATQASHATQRRYVGL